MEELTSALRHDLRTPLNHVIGYGEMLLEALAEDDVANGPGVEALREIVARSREQVRLLQNARGVDDARAALRDDRTLNEIYVLSGALGSRYQDDVRKMQQAAERIASFAGGGAGPVSERAAEPTANTAAPGGSRGTMLAVDDNPQNRELLKRMLERQGYSVTMAANGEECLRLLAEQRFDLVLLDVIMPGLSGFDVLSRIRTSEEWRNLPVIVVSALDESSAAIRCIEMGAEDYLPKPFDPVLLNARIGATLEKKRLRDQEIRYARELEQALDELRQAQDRLVVQEKLASLGALTAGIAHELKNPLNFITNFAALAREAAGDLRRELDRAQLESAEPDREEIGYLIGTIVENVGRIEDHGRRADRIVRGMLLHSRGQSGARELSDINGLVEEALNLAYHGIRARDHAFNVNIRREFQPDLARVPVRSEEISRVLLNILNNAFYAMNEKRKNAPADYAPELLAQTSDEGDSIAILLEDNGSGISAPLQKKIFDPFFTTKPAGSGTGLGLSISFDIIRAHEGSLSVESEPGRFARFRIVLPKQVSDRARV
jgi:signal transduction histidine kinase